MSDASQPERSRLREVIVALLGEDSSDTEIGSSPRIDSAVRAAGDTLRRWSGGETFRRLLGGIERDVLTRPGEWVALEAKVGVTGRRGGTARFLLDGKQVAETTIGEHSEVRAMIRASEPGVYQASVEHDIGSPSGEAVVQVVGAGPLVLFDAALFFVAEAGPSPAVEALLRALLEAELEVAYFDIGAEDRRLLVRRHLARFGMPAAAVLSYEAEARDLEKLGADLGRVLGFAAVNRLLARGVAVSVIVTDRLDQIPEMRAPLTTLSPAGAQRRLDSDGFAEERRRAAALIATHAEADSLQWRLDHMTGSRAVSGNAVIAELDNGRARRRLFEMIEQARQSIHVQFYIVRPSAFAEELVVRLIQSARRGVNVRLMVDALYSDQEVLGRVNPLVLALKAEPNVEVLALSPIERPRDVDMARLKKRDHRKLVIIDGERAIVSGRNAGDEYYQSFDEVPIHDQTDHERIPWLDAHMELAGPIVTEVQRCFLATWCDHGGRPPENREALLPKLTPAGESGARFVVHHGLADANAMAMYETLLEIAEDHVYIVNDFPIVSTLERSILRAHARGVRVELLTGSAASRRADGSPFPAPVHRTMFELMVKARLEPLMLAGVTVYELGTPRCPMIVARGGRVRPYVHAKLMSVDGRVCSVGSANLDATSSYWESEANVVVDDPAFVSALEARLRELIADSFALDPQSAYWQSERAQRAVVSKLWPDTLYS